MVIKQINNFIAATFKASTKEDLDANLIQRLGKPLGITLTRQQVLDPKYLTSREFLSSSKEILLKLLYATINRSNRDILTDQNMNNKQFHYKFHIGRGNNNLVVRQVVKQRWWWSMSNKEDMTARLNFLWTQW